MQSGTRKTKAWRLEYDVVSAPEVEPLMGWTSTADPTRQIKLAFPTREDAIRYATRNGIPYRVEEEHEPADKRMSYSDNFRADRPAPWTH